MTSDSPTLVCPKCGTPVSGGTHCQNCGTPLLRRRLITAQEWATRNARLEERAKAREAWRDAGPSMWERFSAGLERGLTQLKEHPTRFIAIGLASLAIVVAALIVLIDPARISQDRLEEEIAGRQNALSRTADVFAWCERGLHPAAQLAGVLCDQLVGPASGGH